jgi:hypothetical protein
MSMETPTLLEDGDALERGTWDLLRSYFPHYEDFWRTHLVPLRSQSSIYPRQGIDEDFEFLAMHHYSTYASLVRAFEKIQSPEETLRFPDEIYVNLSRSAELANKAMDRFSRIYRDCTGDDPKMAQHTRAIEQMKDKLDDYRNLVHEQLPAIRIDPDERAKIPRREKIQVYRKWTDVLYEYRSEDFVEIKTQLHNDFSALCSTFETGWKRMCELSETLTKNKDYLSRRGKGQSASFKVAATAGTVLLQYSATAVSCTSSSVWVTDTTKE